MIDCWVLVVVYLWSSCISCAWVQVVLYLASFGHLLILAVVFDFLAVVFDFLRSPASCGRRLLAVIGFLKSLNSCGLLASCDQLHAVVGFFLWSLISWWSLGSCLRSSISCGRWVSCGHWFLRLLISCSHFLAVRFLVVFDFLRLLGSCGCRVLLVIGLLRSSISCGCRFFAAAGFLWLSSSFGNWVIAVVDFLWWSIFCCCWVLVAVEFFW